MFEKKKIILPVAFGSILELYDFAIYGILVPIMAPLFFPHTDSFVSIISSLGVLAIGFFARPIGAIYFGYIGDKKGRREALTLSLFGMSFATFGIGLLPTYQSIGPLAPVLLIVLRMIQGICVGGESTGASVFNLEHTKDTHLGVIGGIISASMISGVILASIVVYFTQRFIPNPDISWRLPFLFGSLVGIVGFYIRSYLPETPPFKKMVQTNAILRNPLILLFQDNKLPLFYTFGIGCLLGVAQLNLAGYFTIHLSSFLGQAYDKALFINILILFIIYMPLLIYMGYLSDKKGTAFIMKKGCLFIIVIAIPVYWLLNTNHIVSIFLAQALYAMGVGMIVGPKAAYLYRLFPTAVRYSGISLGYSLGVALFGGMTPLLNTFAIKVTGSLLSPAFLLMLIGSMGYVLISISEKG